MQTTHNSYVPLKTSKRGHFHQLLSCLLDLKCWMSQNVFQLNENKSDIIIFEPSQFIPTSQKQLSSANVKPAARNQGVIFKTEL